MPVGTGFFDLRAAGSPHMLGLYLAAGYRVEDWLAAYGEGRLEKPRLGPIRGSIGVGLRGSF